jgi:small subunit ribosomal protein S20
MAKRHESALRQHRRSLRARTRNRTAVSKLRTAVRRLRALVADKKADEAKKLLAPTISLVDHSVARKALHRNAASRLKSRLTRQVAAL